MVTFEIATGKYNKISYDRDTFLCEKNHMENLRKIKLCHMPSPKGVKVYRTSDAFFMMFDSFLTADMNEAPFNPAYSDPCVFEITGAKQLFILSTVSDSASEGYYTSYEYHYLVGALGKENELYFYHIEPTLSKSVFAGMVSKDCFHDVSQLSIRKGKEAWIISSFQHPTLSPRVFFQRIHYGDERKNQLITIATKDILFETANALFLRNGFLDKATGLLHRDDGSYEGSLVWDKAFYVIPFLRKQPFGSENYWIGYRGSRHLPESELEGPLNDCFMNADYNQYQPHLLDAFVWSKKEEKELYPIQQAEEDTWLLCYDLLLPHIVKCPRSVLCGNDIYQRVLQESTSEFFYFVYYHPTEDPESLAYFVSDQCPTVLASNRLQEKFQEPKDIAILIRNSCQFEGEDVFPWGDVVITIDVNHTLKNRLVAYNFKSLCNLEGPPKEQDPLAWENLVQYAALLLVSGKEKLCVFFDYHLSQEFDTCAYTEFPGLFRVTLLSLPDVTLYYYVYTNEILSEEQFKDRFAKYIWIF